MRKKLITSLLIATTLGMTVKASTPNGIVPDDENQLRKMKTTAYYCGTTTATGLEARKGMVAVDREHLGNGWLALIYSEDGTEFYGIYECEDLGGTDAILNGYVIDVRFDNYDECKEWMKLTNGKCLVKYVKGEG